MIWRYRQGYGVRPGNDIEKMENLITDSLSIAPESFTPETEIPTFYDMLSLTCSNDKFATVNI